MLMRRVMVRVMRVMVMDRDMLMLIRRVMLMRVMVRVKMRVHATSVAVARPFLTTPPWLKSLRKE